MVENANLSRHLLQKKKKKKKKKKKNDHTQIMRNFIVASNEVPSAEGHRFHF